MAKESSDSPESEPVLPTTESDANGVTAQARSPVDFQAQPTVYRRHTRKKSSTIIVPPMSPTRSTASSADLSTASIDADETSANVTRGATILALAQILAKLLSFVLNQVLLRFVAAIDLGYAAQLDFFGSTVLTLSRDAIRLTSQRRHIASQRVGNGYRPDKRPIAGTQSGTQQEAANLGWVSFGGGTALTAIIVLAFMTFGSNGQSSIAAGAIMLYGAAVVVELSSEPAFLLLQLKSRLDLRAKAEACATVVRCLVTLVLIVIAHTPPALAFASAQLANAATVSVLYSLWAAIEYRHALFTLRPQRIRESTVTLNDGETLIWADPDSLKLVMGLESQGVAKYFLTEGDKLAVGFITTMEQQGEYALAANYGSLVARLVLFPIEEVLRAYFSRILQRLPAQARTSLSHDDAKKASLSIEKATEEGPEDADEIKPKSENHETNEKKKSGGLRRSLSNRIAPERHEPSRNSVGNSKSYNHRRKEAVATLATLLRAYTYAGVIAVSFGPPVARYALKVLLSGSRGNWLAERSQTADVLAAYCWYMPMLAWNGALEAFVQSAAGLNDLKHQRFTLIILAVIFVILVYAFVDVLSLGSVGLVWAQVVTMGLRIAWSSWFVTRWTSSKKWLKGCFPHLYALAVAVVCVGMAQGVGEVTSVNQLAVHCGLALTILLAVAGVERENIRAVIKNR